MTNNKFTVGIKVDGTRHSVTVMAEDALVAALKVKLEQPTAAINFVRRCNRRGDLRHPHEAVAAGPLPGSAGVSPASPSLPSPASGGG